MFMCVVVWVGATLSEQQLPAAGVARKL
jgi:hypothetical protein